MELKLGFVQRRIAAEKMGLICVLSSIILFLLIFLCSMLATGMKGSRGIKDLTSNEEISRFYNSAQDKANLHFEKATGLGKRITITTTQRQGLSMFVGGIYIEGALPLAEPEKKTAEDYTVYLLENNDYAVLLCAPRLQIMDFSRNIIEVCNNYKNLRGDIIKKFPNAAKPAYVFFTPPLRLPTAKAAMLCAIAILLIILSSVLSFVVYSKTIQKRSKLGGKISELGDYDSIAKAINRQAGEAIYKKENVMILKDFCLLWREKCPNVIPIKQISSITSKPNKKYPGEVIDIEIDYNNQPYQFSVYDKTSERKISGHIISTLNH